VSGPPDALVAPGAREAFVRRPCRVGCNVVHVACDHRASATAPEVLDAQADKGPVPLPDADGALERRALLTPVRLVGMISLPRRLA
jgi:hypothetical protein